jgi:hypothetical protein
MNSFEKKRTSSEDEENSEKLVERSNNAICVSLFISQSIVINTHKSKPSLSSIDI